MAENKEDIRPVGEIIPELAQRVMGVEYDDHRTNFMLDYSGIYTFADLLLPEELSKYGKGITFKSMPNNMMVLALPTCAENKDIIENIRAEWAEKRFIPALARKIDNVKYYAEETRFVLDEQGIIDASSGIFLANNLMACLPSGEKMREGKVGYDVQTHSLVVPNKPIYRKLIADVSNAWVADEIKMIDNIKEYMLKNDADRNKTLIEKLAKSFYNNVQQGCFSAYIVAKGCPESTTNKIFANGRVELDSASVLSLTEEMKLAYKKTKDPMLYNAVLLGSVKASLDKADGKEPFSLKVYAEQRSRNVRTAGDERGGR